MKGFGYVIGWLLAAIAHLLNKTLILFIKIFNLQDKPIIQRIYGNSISVGSSSISQPNFEYEISKVEVKEDWIPESFDKGEKFEEYIRKELFTKDKYVIVERSHNYSANKGDYIESTLKPDYKFRCKRTNEEFYIEAKYRSGLFKDKIQWSNMKQIKRYKEYAQELPFYTVIGLGGNPENPKNMYMLKVDNKTRVSVKETELGSLEFDSQKRRYSIN